MFYDDFKVAVYFDVRFVEGDTEGFRAAVDHGVGLRAANVLDNDVVELVDVT